MARSTALFRLQSCVLVAEILATPLSAYLMTFGPMFPYILSIGVIIVGGIPALFLPETLEDAKAKRTRAEPQQNSGPEHLQPDKRSVFQEVSRQAHEFADSTRFIWSDSNVCLMIVVLFVTVISRQCTNLLLQYVSTKFNWSIGRVCTTSHLSSRQTNQATGQSPHIPAWDIRSGNVPTRNAVAVLHSSQILQPTR
jgi:Trk-type K+ transport system membrane component